MRSSKLWIPTIAVFLLGVATAAWLALRPAPRNGVALPSASPRAGALPIMWPAPQFAFPDQDDSAVSTQSLAGKVWIVDFIFTHCGNTCPRMTGKRIELQKQITDPRVMFLSISVDPERDDRKTRKTYAAEKGVDESRWKFVSPPDKAAALKIAQQMKVAALVGPHSHEEPILHSDRFVLLDTQSRIRGIYPLDDAAAMQRLVNDATALAKDAR